MKKTVIYWIRRDLRLHDNPALLLAVSTNRPIYFVYVLDDSNTQWKLGAASRWWLHHSLSALQSSLKQLGANLHFIQGSALAVLPEIAKYFNSDLVVCSRIYEPASLKQDEELKNVLNKNNVQLKIAQGNILFKPGAILNKQGATYKVFTPFYKACMMRGISSEIFDAPTRLSAVKETSNTLTLNELNLLPTLPWDSGLKNTWTPGEKTALNLLDTFINQHLLTYSEQRDFPDLDSTSHLSPYLRFGEITPQRIIHQLNQARYSSPATDKQADNITRQLIWREFATHILLSFPHTLTEPFQEKFKYFPWISSDSEQQKAWEQGKTGFPIIDAGMRELWHTGTMHNRVRMIVASFLCKNCLLHWRTGANWFWDTLVDADLAQNTMNWQWVAGCGVDAAPYFRIFNPVTQSKKFDAEGHYIRRWCPELGKLRAKHIHSPETAPANILQQADIKLGVDYPYPILSLTETRDRALTIYKSLSH